MAVTAGRHEIEYAPTRTSTLMSWRRRAIPSAALEEGEIIFRKGDPAAELLIVKTGTVEIRIGNSLIDTLGERSIFGEMALIDRGPRSATG